MSKFVLKIFVPEDGKYVEIDDVALGAGTPVTAGLTTDEQALYQMMRDKDVDMAHIPFPDEDKQKLVASGQAAAFIFGTFYVNLGAFKKK